MDPLSIATVGVAALGSGINAYSTGRMNKRAERFSREMYGKQRQDALSDWNMQNAYNDPSSQMARLKNAGLNPHLVYGNGNAVQSAPTPRSASASQPNFKAPQVDTGSVIFNALQAKQIQSNIAHTDAQTDLLRSQKTAADYRNEVFTPEKLAEELNTKITSMKMSSDVANVNADIRQLELDNLNLISGNTIGSNRHATMKDKDVKGENALNGIQEKFNAEMTKLNQQNLKLTQEVSTAEAEKLLREYEVSVIKSLGVDRGTAVNIVQNLIKMFFMSYRK